MKTAEEIRCLNDRRLFEALLATNEVKRANEQLARMAEKGPQKFQVLRDLCLVAQAGSRNSDQERAALKKVATALEVPEKIVGQTLDCDLDLD